MIRGDKQEANNAIRDRDRDTGKEEGEDPLNVKGAKRLSKLRELVCRGALAWPPVPVSRVLWRSGVSTVTTKTGGIFLCSETEKAKRQPDQSRWTVCVCGCVWRVVNCAAVLLLLLLQEGNNSSGGAFHGWGTWTGSQFSRARRSVQFVRRRRRRFKGNAEGEC